LACSEAFRSFQNQGVIMSEQFNEELFKQRTREMVAFFKEKGVEVPLTLGYEGAARFLFGAKSWNHLSGELKTRPVTSGLGAPVAALDADSDSQSDEASVAPSWKMGPPRLMCRWLVRDSEKADELVISATVSTADKSVRAKFPVTLGFHVLQDERILTLAAAKWRDPRFVIVRANMQGATMPGVEAVLDYADAHPESPLLGVIDRTDAVRYVRAFRPHLLAKVLLLEVFGTLEAAAKDGYEVREAKTGRGIEWEVISAGERLYPQEHQSDYFDDEVGAWQELMWYLLQQPALFRVKQLSRVLHGSGYVD
jgi:hypothetical protein